MTTPVRAAFIERKGIASGYPYYITFGAYAYRCGYVGVPSEHPEHGERGENLYAHIGRVTWARSGVEINLDANLWFFGFHCDHHNEDAPDLISFIRHFGLGAQLPERPLNRAPSIGTVRTEKYVLKQIQWLARQLKALEGP